MNDTVFALSTPVGGAITIMRISGANAREILRSIFTGSIINRRVSYGRILDENGETLDTCTAVLFESPNSYTGEDVVEISVHGSYAVASRLMELIASTGLARPANPGEFTKRAYLNGKMDLAQAEAVMDLISSTAERQRRAAAQQLEGRLSSVILSLYERIKLCCAELSAAMDDDTDEITLDTESLSNRLNGIGSELKELVNGGMRAKVLREGARIAIIGSPNVGKSSLLNALIRYERSIVTPIPGTTRDTVEESASIKGLPVVFIDTAGIRDTDDTVERLGIERSLREEENADLILLLVDGSRGIGPEDRSIIEGLNDPGKTIAVITKSDLPQCVYKDEDGKIMGLSAMNVSSVTGDGLTALTERIAEILSPTERESAVTNTRHIDLIARAARHTGTAAEKISERDTDIAYFELREAMDRLASVIGREDPSEELVDAIFSSFCVGK